LVIGSLPGKSFGRLCSPGKSFWVPSQKPAQVFTRTGQEGLPVLPGEPARLIEQDRCTPLAIEKKSEGDKLSGHLLCVHFFSFLRKSGLGFNSDETIVKTAFVNLLAIHQDMPGGLDADPHFSPLDRNHGDAGVCVDNNRFTHAAREN
jgi:hypothetical protein